MRVLKLTFLALILALGCAAPPPVELTDADREAIRQFFDELTRISYACCRLLQNGKLIQYLPISRKITPIKAVTVNVNQ